MSRTPSAFWDRWLAIDALIGLAIFLAVVVSAGGSAPTIEPRQPGDLLAYSTEAGELVRGGAADLAESAASMAQGALPVPVAGAQILSGRLNPPSVTLLAVIVSLLVVLDLALFRHLRRVYASSRRSGWRRG